MRFLSLLSGDTYKPPHRETMRKIEKKFEQQCRDNIRDRLIHAHILKTDGSGPLSNGFPFASLSIDKSTTTIAFQQGLSLNLHFLSWKPVKISLGVSPFKLTPVEDRTLERDIQDMRGDATNVTRWVIQVLTTFNLVPKDEHGAFVMTEEGIDAISLLVVW